MSKMEPLKNDSLEEISGGITFKKATFEAKKNCKSGDEEIGKFTLKVESSPHQ